MFLRACAIALEIATGTSRALPKPKPTRPAPSPTTVSAVKPNCRPPLTTLAVRLTATSFSTNSSCDWPFSGLAICMSYLLELKARFAGRVRERLDAPVVLEAGTVEGHLAHPGRLAALGDGPSDGLGRLDVAGVLQALAHRLLQGGGCRDHPGAFGVGDLRVNVVGRAMHGQARRRQSADVGAGLHGAPQAALFLGDDHFFLPSLSVIFSPA